MSNETIRISQDPAIDKAVKGTQHSRLGRVASGAKAASRFGLGAIAGMGAFALMGFAKADPVNENGDAITSGKPSIPDEPTQASNVNDNMTFDEAFAAARAEVGPTGYFVWHGKVFNPIYSSEMDQLSKEEQSTLYSNTMNQWREDMAGATSEAPGAIVIHDEAPEATTVNDSMSFNDAFVNARAEVGPGGVFEWRGNLYSTYSKEEWSAMNEENKQEFYASAGHIAVDDPQVSQQQVNIAQIDGTTPTALTSAGQEGTMIAEEYVSDGQGGRLHVALFEVNGEIVVKADSDGDGRFDTIIKPDAQGNLAVTNDQGYTEVVTQQTVQDYQSSIDENMALDLPSYDDYVFPTNYGNDFDPSANDVAGDWL